MINNLREFMDNTTKYLVLICLLIILFKLTSKFIQYASEILAKYLKTQTKGKTIMNKLTLDGLLNLTNLYTEVVLIEEDTDSILFTGTASQCLFNYNCEELCVTNIQAQNKTMLIKVN